MNGRVVTFVARIKASLGDMRLRLGIRMCYLGGIIHLERYP